jgi:hypothetical protein
MDNRPYFCCLVCDQPLEPCYVREDGDVRFTPVYHGLHFQAGGAFGTTVFDPHPDDPSGFLEIVICDRCLIKKQAQVRLFLKDKSLGSFSAEIANTVSSGDRSEPAT